MKKIIGIAFIIVLIFVFSGCSSVITYNRERYESKSVGEIQYANIDSDFSTAIDTKEKVYKESDILGLFLNVGAEGNYGNEHNKFNEINTVILKSNIGVIQNQLEQIANNITNMSYKFKVVVNNGYSYVNLEDEVKKGIWVIEIETDTTNLGGNSQNHIIRLNPNYFYVNNGKLKNSSKNVVSHEIYHNLGLAHYTYSFDNIEAKNGRKINTLPKFAKMNTMSYSDGVYESDRNYYISNPDDIKLIELFSTVPNLVNRIEANTCIKVYEFNYNTILADIIDTRIYDKYNIVISTERDRFNKIVPLATNEGIRPESVRDINPNDTYKTSNYTMVSIIKNKVTGKDVHTFYDIQTMKEDASGSCVMNPSLSLTILLLNKVGVNVIDRMFAEKKPIGEIIDYAEKYYNTELLSAIDLYLEAKLVKYFDDTLYKTKTVEVSNKTLFRTEIITKEVVISTNNAFTRADFDARLKKKYQRELTTSQEIFSSLRDILKSKGVM